MKYLALGDSYTIGESLPFEQNFPSQVVEILKSDSITIELDKLIAVTGWTTDELAIEIAKQKPHFEYDWVTLLIGVNNQYRGRSVEEYEWQFYALLSQAVLFAKGNPKRVIVLSIPDWGLTPFNKDRDKIQTSQEIDEFNDVNRKIAQHFACHYVDVTTSTRAHCQDGKFLAEDGLHYSAQEYNIWATSVAEIIRAEK